jgi:hypothetical protein
LTWVAYLTPALIGLLVVPAERALQPIAKARFVFFASLAGVAAAVGLFLLRHSETEWRTTLVRPGPVVAAAVAAGCAWLLVAVLDPGEGRWQRAALTGVAASAVALFAANQWIVPALLFWVAHSAAVWMLFEDHPQSATARMLLAMSDVALVASLTTHAIAEESWTIPLEADGIVLGLAAAAAIIRVGLLPLVATDTAEGRSGPELPLVVGGAFVLVTGLAEAEQPWVGLALVVVAFALGLWSVLSRRLDLGAIAGWGPLVMLAVLFVVPGAPWQAAAGGLLTLTAAVLWPHSLGRAQIERGLLLALVPPAAAFSAVVVSAVATFDQATAGGSLVEAIPWAAVTALLPAVLALGIALGTRIARQREPEAYEPSAVIATWAVFLAALASGMWPRLPASTASATSRAFVLNVIAIGLGIVAARLFVGVGAKEDVVEEGPHWSERSLRLPPELARGTEWFALGAAGVSIAATLWLTFSGLRVGFL